MDFTTKFTLIENISTNTSGHGPRKNTTNIDVMAILSFIIASVGIVANLTVVVAFLNSKKLKGKIPNIFIINQVRTLHD